MAKVTLNLPPLMAGHFRLTNRRTVKDAITVDMDADGKVLLQLEFGARPPTGQFHTFELSKKAIRLLIAELAFYLQDPLVDPEEEEEDNAK